MPRKLSEGEILVLNPQIDPVQVARFEAFREEARKAGTDVTPRYLVSPPLGELLPIQPVSQSLAEVRRKRNPAGSP